MRGEKYRGGGGVSRLVADAAGDVEKILADDGREWRAVSGDGERLVADDGVAPLVAGAVGVCCARPVADYGGERLLAGDSGDGERLVAGDGVAPLVAGAAGVCCARPVADDGGERLLAGDVVARLVASEAGRDSAVKAWQTGPISPPTWSDCWH